MAASCSRSRLAKRGSEGRRARSSTRRSERNEPRVGAPCLCDIVACSRHADVAELVDARRSGRRARQGVEVRVLSSAFLRNRSLRTQPLSPLLLAALRQRSARVRRCRNAELFTYGSCQTRPDLSVPREGRDIPIRPTPLCVL